MVDSNEIIKESLNSILDEDSFNKVLRNSIKQGDTSKQNTIITLIIILISIPIIISIGYSENTIDRFSIVVNKSQDLMVSLFGIVFTGYALFQAFTTGKIVERLLTNTGRYKNMFQEFNLYFFKTSFSYLLIIILNFILSIILENLSPVFYVSSLSNATNNLIATMLILIYFIINIYLILEIKCLLYNIYQSFNIKAIDEGINAINNNC